MCLINTTAYDTVAPLSWFGNQGYYLVGKEIFRNKVYAMQAATKQQLKPKDVIWVFNDDVYDAVNWKEKTDVRLWDLYRMRAQQLREKYSYLIISFSGGGDSTNILDTFVLNNIHVDEVLVYWPRKLTANRYVPNLDTDPRNIVSEWDYLVEPKLKWLETVAPKTKITIIDTSESLPIEDPTDDVVEVTAKHNYVGYQRYKKVDQLLLERQIKYPNYTLITGVNPPMLVRVKRHLMLFFSDAVTSAYTSDYTNLGLCRNVEFFYWTPSMPDIPKSQAHALLDNLKTNPQYINLISQWHIGGPKQPAINKPKVDEQYRRWVKSVIYPTYNHQNLQVDKNTSPNFKPEWFSWFYDNPHSKEIMTPHQSGITWHQNLIDPDFFIARHGQVHDYHAYRSKLYHVGDIPNLENII